VSQSIVELGKGDIAKQKGQEMSRVPILFCLFILVLV